MIEYLQHWLNAIEVKGFIDNIADKKENELAWNLYELLDKCISQWEEIMI